MSNSGPERRFVLALLVGITHGSSLAPPAPSVVTPLGMTARLPAPVTVLFPTSQFLPSPCILSRRLDPSRPDIQSGWTKQGAVPFIMTQPRFKTFMEGQVATWAKVINDNRIPLIK